MGKLGLFFGLLQSWAGNRLPRLNNQFSTGIGMRTAYIVIGSRQTWAGETLLFVFLLYTPETRQRLAWCF